ncbi:MAG TPA: glycosyltransferase family 39 protein [Solirubrobacteraceae bacterium]|nr:glycosyltransferase family 39 protein [Solirubrobacteraceae bacterium]
MNTPQTASPPGSASAGAALEGTSEPARRAGLFRGAHPAVRHLALLPVLALSAVLDMNRLSQNGYANIFYSAGVKSMLRSWHNFLFVSFDPGGLITVDKPPLALWVQAASAKLFGFSPTSLLLPEAIAGVLSVAALYYLMNRRFGFYAALAGALALAVFPSFVAVSRDNSVDSLLILLMILACEAGLRAAETGRWRALLLCGVLVGLAFNTKTLAAYLVVPGIVLAYAVCAPGSLIRRGTQLVAGGLLMLAVSFSWITFVELTPASARPFVGSSTNNTELGLTFEYNGLGRVGGQTGGPGRIPAGAGALVHLPPVKPGKPPVLPASRPHAAVRTPRAPTAGPRAPARPSSPVLHNGRDRYPIAFGGPLGPLRLFGTGLGDQGGWILPFALFGLLGVAITLLPESRSSIEQAGTDQAGSEPATAAGQLRHDRRLAALIVLGGWFLVEAAILSLSKGIVHPYYVSALAPGAAAMAGAGAVALTDLAVRRGLDWRRILAPIAVLSTVAAQVVLMHREHYMEWFVPVLVAAAVVGVCVLLTVRRLAPWAMAVTYCLLLVTPAAYASTTWLAPVEGTFPAAGPNQASGAGGVGVGGSYLEWERSLVSYARTHRPGSRWAVFTDAATTAAPMILLGLDAGSLAGYSGTDPAIDGRELAQLVAGGEARYVVLGGEFSTRGGNRATAAVLRTCRIVSPSLWGGPPLHYHGLVLFDCAGRESGLAAE